MVELVGCLVEGERVLELALPGRVRPEGEALGGLTGGVQLDQLGGDLADGPPRAVLALAPVGTAEPVEARLLAADVAGDLVERVGRDEQHVGRPAPLGRAVLEDEVLAGRPLHVALPHLDEPADSVLLVDDEVALLQLERIDLPLPAGGHPALVAGGSALAGEVVAGDQHEPEPGCDEPVGQGRAGDGDDVGLRLDVGVGLDQTGGDVVLGEHLDHALRRPVTGMRHDHPRALVQPATQIGDGPVDVSAIAVDGRRRDRTVGLAGDLVIEAERADRPPRPAELPGVGHDVVQLAVRRGAQVDRRRAPAGRGRPRGAEELLARRHQVVGAAADTLGIDDQDLGVVGHHVDEQLHLVDQHRGQRLHALDRDAGRELRGHLGELGMRLAQRGRAAADVLGEEQLAAGRCPQPVDLLDRALVGDGERADLVDLVAPELHPDRVLLGRREDVDQAAPDGELAALLDQVDPRVRRVRESPGHVVELRLVAEHELHRLEVPESADLRLQDRAHRRDDHAEPSGDAVGAGMAQATQHGQPPADGVAAGTEPLVRQRLPARVVGQRVGLEQGAELLGQLLGLASGGRHQQHRPTRAHQPLH